MIHVVSAENQHLYGPQLDQMFALRRTGALDRIGPELTETDALDDERALYLLDVDNWGEVFAAVRACPSGPGWVLGRWLVRQLGEQPAELILATLVVGLLEFCVSRGLSRMKLEAGQAITPWLRLCGCTLRGPANGACELEASPATLASARQKTGIHGRLLFEIAGARPAASR